MITGPRKQFEDRVRLRGYAMDAVRACIVSEDSETVTVDERHPAYPAARTEVASAPKKAHGPGTILKAFLRRWLGIKASPNCPCNARARKMDEWGPDECERRLDEIVGWLGEEAARRRLPFIPVLARQAVLFAIRKSRNQAPATPG